MARTHTSARRQRARLLIAAMLAAMLAAGTATTVSARPAHEDLVKARAELGALNQRLSLLVERYDETTVDLEANQARLAAAQAAAGLAQATWEAARAELSLRAAAAYEAGPASQISVILGASSLSDLTDRIEFVGALARQDVEAANQAQLARTTAQASARRLSAVVSQRATLLQNLTRQKADILAGITTQKKLIGTLERELAGPIVLDPALPAGRMPPLPGTGPGPKPSPHPSPSPQPSPSPHPSPRPPPPSPPPPPPPGPGAPIAVRAAYSVIGVPYVWGGADPKVGFDCSGLTMWAWAKAGRSLPHSAAYQYAVIRHVTKAQLRPGDLVFFYRPISHVGIYVGHGLMIDAPHIGGFVGLRPVYWAAFVGAGRP